MPKDGRRLFVNILKKNRIQRTIEVNMANFIFGRHSRLANHVLHHETVSRQHCSILSNEDGQYYLVDLKSTHGTCIGKRTVLSPYEPVLLQGTFYLDEKLVLI